MVAQGLGLGGNGRGLGQLGAQLLHAPLALGFAGFEGLELLLQLGLGVALLLFEALLFGAAGGGLGGGVAVGGVVGNVVGPEPAPGAAQEAGRGGRPAGG